MPLDKYDDYVGIFFIYLLLSQAQGWDRIEDLIYLQNQGVDIASLGGTVVMLQSHRRSRLCFQSIHFLLEQKTDYCD